MAEAGVVITTIHAPSAAVVEHCRNGMMRGYDVVIVGDVTTPAAPYESLAATYPNVCFLSIDAQRRLFPRLAALLPMHHYARKDPRVSVPHTTQVRRHRGNRRR
jgi:hypothetical protein